MNPSQNIRKNNKNIRKKSDIQNENTRKRTSKKLKQKLLANNKCLRKYKVRQKQYHQNRDFKFATQILP